MSHIIHQNVYARATWLIHTVTALRIRMRHVALANGVMSHIWISHVTLMNGVSSHWCTGWRRLIGSPKLQIIFHKRATKYRSLLRKMTCTDKGSYESSPPCISRIYSYMCRIYEQRHVTHLNKSCHADERSRVTNLNELCYTFSHFWRESCHTSE